MKNLTSLFIFVITLLQTNFTTACTCAVDWSFCETVNNSYHIAEAEVLALYGDPNGDYEYMDIKIIETLQNGITEDSLTVLANYIFCHDLLISQFTVGDKLIVNFSQTYTDSLNIPDRSFIDFFSCHTNFLKLDQNDVNGNISPTLTSQNYDDFKNNLTACNDLIASNEELEGLENEISIFPNPFSENVNIDFGELATSKISLEIFSAQGQKITTENNLSQSNFQYSTTNFSAGIYFVKIIFRDNFIVKKIVKY